MYFPTIYIPANGPDFRNGDGQSCKSHHDENQFSFSFLPFNDNEAKFALAIIESELHSVPIACHILKGPSPSFILI